VKTKGQLCALVGARVALLCASLGALTAFALAYVRFSPETFWEILDQGWPAIAVGLVGLYLVAWLLGRGAGRAIAQRKHGYPGAIFLGVGVALCGLVAAMFLGSLAYGVRDSGEHWADAALIFGLYLTIFWSLPAALFGVLCGVLLRWRLTKAGC
jgi:hypothetical protein